MDLDTPEGRYAASQALGPDGYSKAMADHAKANTVATVNGYSLRWVASRFGRLCMVVESPSKAAFHTQAEAETHAMSLPPYWPEPVRNLTLKISSREDWFLFAAIRMWQQVERGTLQLINMEGNRFGVDHFEDIASCGWQDRALDAAEVDDMACEVFGCDPWLNDDERKQVIAARGEAR